MQSGVQGKLEIMEYPCNRAPGVQGKLEIMEYHGNHATSSTGKTGDYGVSG